MLGSHISLFFVKLQALLLPILAPLIFCTHTPIVVLDTLTTLYLTQFIIQCGFTGLTAAANVVLNWLNRPPPWPDEIWTHRYPRHQRKFGQYYKIRTLTSAIHLGMRLVFLLTTHRILASGLDYHPLDYAQYTSGWASQPAPPPTPVPPTHILNLGNHDPSSIMAINRLSLHNSTTTPTTTPTGFISTLHNVTCLNAISDTAAMLIIDSGASVCITPHRNDFITYQNSSVQIKDLSASTAVAGEGLLEWTLQDSSGTQHTLTLPGYHMPTAKVRLLSPQILLAAHGGTSTQMANRVTITLGDGTLMTANYCPRSNLPYLAYTGHPTQPTNFWPTTFDYTDNTHMAF